MLFEVIKRTSILALGRAHHGFKSLTPTVLVLFRKNVILSYTRVLKSTKYVKRSCILVRQYELICEKLYIAWQMAMDGMFIPVVLGYLDHHRKCKWGECARAQIVCCTYARL